MSAVSFWFLRTFRSRIRAYAGVAVLLALLGGLTMASFAGARHTASAYPRFRHEGRALDVLLFAGEFETEYPGLAGRLPGVTGTATYVAFLAAPITPDGRPDLTGPPGEVAASFDGLYFTRDRFFVTEGRMPDASRADEAVVNERMADAGDVRVGQQLHIGVFDPAQEDAVYSDDPPPPVDRLDITVVGVGLFPDEVVQDDTDRTLRVMLTPAFAQRELPYVTYAWTGVDVEGGEAGVERYKSDYLAAGVPTSFRETSVVVTRTQHAVRPLAVALGVFGALAAAATILLVGQALYRLLRADRDDLVALRAMGAGPGLVLAVSVPGVIASVVAGVIGAVAVAVVLSPLAPIGPLRRVEPDRGLSFDWTVLALGAAGFVLVLLLVAWIAARRQAPHRRLARARLTGARRSRIAGALFASGLPPSATAGMRLALETGEGRTAVPVRAALLGAVVAVVALVASLVFGTSLRSLVDQPKLYGWDWDLTLLDESGYGEIDVDAASAVLDDEPAVAAWSAAFFQSVNLGDHTIPALGVEAGADVVPPLLAGRNLQGPDEVVVGTKTLAALGKRIGDMVVLAPDEIGTPLRIVGTAVFPTVGPIFGAYTSLGDGAMMVYDQIPEWDEVSPGPKALFVRFVDDVDPAAVERIEAELAEVGRFSGSAAPLPVQRPAEIVNYGAMGATPALLAAVLVLAAVLSLGLTLAAGVGRRRRDLSILKSLGFTRRQVSATVVWQSSIIVAMGLAIGVPVGIALGRWLWILFAERLPVLARPTVPVLALVGVACVLVVLANLVAAVPARVAGRTPVAVILRSE